MPLLIALFSLGAALWFAKLLTRGPLPSHIEDDSVRDIMRGRRIVVLSLAVLIGASFFINLLAISIETISPIPRIVRFWLTFGLAWFTFYGNVFAYWFTISWFGLEIAPTIPMVVSAVSGGDAALASNLLLLLMAWFLVITAIVLLPDGRAFIRLQQTERRSATRRGKQIYEIESVRPLEQYHQNGQMGQQDPMYVIDQEDPPEQFIEAWGAARDHINRLLPSTDKTTGVGPAGGWLRNNIFKPFSEHLSFRLGNQIFMVYVDPYIDGQSIYPCSGNRRHLFRQIVDDANAFGCILRMDRTGEEFNPFFPNSGMIDISTDGPIEPSEKITDELIEMTEWELLDLGIQAVRNGLAEDGKEIMSWQSALRIDPSIWFRDADGDHWVVVRTARYPELHAPVPQNIDAIKKSCTAMSDSGFFASVSVASADDEFTGQNVRPLYRGHRFLIRKDFEAV